MTKEGQYLGSVDLVQLHDRHNGSLQLHRVTGPEWVGNQPKLAASQSVGALCDEYHRDLQVIAFLDW